MLFSMRLLRCFIFFLPLLLAGCAGTYDPEKFQSFLHETKQQALAANITEAVVNREFAHIQYVPRIIEWDRNQPEFTLSFAEYTARAVNNKRIAQGQAQLASHKSALRRAQTTYDVPPEIIVALWGIETNFGEHKGKIDILDALATLAYDGRRSAYFQREFIQALKLIDDRPYLPRPLLGSWAGAMGQFQFMPSSYNKFAVDGDGNGKINLWTSTADGFASAANYLKQSGWQKNGRLYTEVTLGQTLDDEIFGLKTQKTIAEWQEIGIAPISGENFPKAGGMASLIRPDGDSGRAFLVYSNYRVIMAWNRSHHFALSVGMLADSIRSGKMPQS